MTVIVHYRLVPGKGLYTFRTKAVRYLPIYSYLLGQKLNPGGTVVIYLLGGLEGQVLYARLLFIPMFNLYPLQHRLNTSCWPFFSREKSCDRW